MYKKRPVLPWLRLETTKDIDVQLKQAIEIPGFHVRKDKKPLQDVYAPTLFVIPKKPK